MDKYLDFLPNLCYIDQITCHADRAAEMVLPDERKEQVLGKGYPENAGDGGPYCDCGYKKRGTV